MADPLSAAQRGKIRRLAAPDAPNPGDEAGEVNVVPFLDIITNVLMFVLATLSVTFTSTVDVSPPRASPNGRGQALGLTVLVANEGFGVKARGGNVASGCSDVGVGLSIPKRNGEYDFAALKECAAKLKASAPEFATEQGVTVSASPQIPYQTVIATMDAVRKAPDGAELFPDVAFGLVR